MTSTRASSLDKRESAIGLERGREGGGERERGRGRGRERGREIKYEKNKDSYYWY